MSDSIQTKGKTVNDAVSEALLQLGLRRDEVEIKVIEEPKSGLLGFIGGRPATVMVRKKPARGRGQSRNNRGRDDQAHSLSGGGRSSRSRGRRGRGGRNNNQDNNQDNKRDNNRGGRSDRGQRQDANEVRAEGRNETRSESRNEGRGGRGGRGRGDRDNRQGARQEGGRNERSRRDTRQQEDSQQRSGRDGGNSRRGGRGRGRGGRDEQVTVERTTEKTSRSRRGNRGGRGRNEQQPEARRDEQVVTREENRSAQVAQKATPVTETRANPAPAAAEVVNSPSNARENTKMTNNKTNQAPAAAESSRPEAAATVPEAATPVAKPKAKRKGWGGGLGSRLPRKTNPAVKNKPEPVVIEEAAPQSSAPAPRREQRSDKRGRGEYRERRPSEDVGEVIIDAVAATKYARPVVDVTEENLDTALAELANGMLARAGFPCEVEVQAGEYRQVRVASDEESAGMLIGRHGQTVDAVEHLVERMACNAVDDRVRMNLDINGYRERRSESLQERVADAIAEVRETGKEYHVEPMSARERRLVHLEAEAAEGIRTFTMIGSGGKYVVIALDNEASDNQQNEN